MRLSLPILQTNPAAAENDSLRRVRREAHSPRCRMSIPSPVPADDGTWRSQQRQRQQPDVQQQRQQNILQRIKQKRTERTRQIRRIPVELSAGGVHF